MSKQRCILIAEDESRIASFVSKGLHKQGYGTVIEERGDCIIDLVLDQEFDLMLLDLGLPHKDGWAILEELSQRQIDMPVIIVTAYAMMADHMDNLSHNVIGVVQKPFRFSHLLKCVNAQLM